MEGYEHPTRDASPHEIFRLSWLAYVGPIETVRNFVFGHNM